MDDFLLYLYFSVCALAVAGIIASPRRLYVYPWAMSVVFTAFVAPQLMTLSNHPSLLPAGAFSALMTVVLLCFAAIWAGYYGSWARLPSGLVSFRTDETRLFHCGVVLMLVGTVFQYLTVREAALGVRDQYGNWTGTVTIYSFFANLIMPGLAILLRSSLRTRSPVAIALTLFALQSPLSAAVFYGRREPTVLAVMIIGMNLYFEKKLVPPRLLVMIGIFGAAVMIPVTAHYRSYSEEHGLGAFAHFDVLEVFLDGTNSGNAPELTFAGHCINNASSSGKYWYGAGYWNTMAFRFVPAQLVGADTKASLTIDTSLTIEDVREASAFIPPGATCTGFGDSFLEFGYFGCLFFAVTGAFFRGLWSPATRGSVPAQLLYMQVLTSSMLAVTHQTSDFLPALTYNILFMGAVLWYSKLRQGERPHMTAVVHGRPTPAALSWGRS